MSLVKRALLCKANACDAETAVDWIVLMFDDNYARRHSLALLVLPTLPKEMGEARLTLDGLDGVVLRYVDDELMGEALDFEGEIGDWRWLKSGEYEKMVERLLDGGGVVGRHHKMAIQYMHVVDYDDSPALLAIVEAESEVDGSRVQSEAMQDAMEYVSLWHR